MQRAVQDKQRPRKPASPLQALPVARAAGTAHICTADGDPIWPYGDFETLAALMRISALFDRNIVEQTPRPADRNGLVDLPRDGVVVSARADADDVASLYAHLTHRRFVSAGEFARERLRHPDVVVAPPEVLTTKFLRRLYSDPRSAPGLISGTTPQSLLRQALVRSAAVRLGGRAARRRVDVRPSTEIDRVMIDGWEILGRKAGIAELRQALGSGSDLLLIFTVGDGIDAQLGSLVLCPMDRKPAQFEGVAPACVISGMCHRLQVPIADALAAGGLVAPEAISARLLILQACWGIQPARALHGPMWGYGYRLADLDGLGAMLTTWEVTITSPLDTEPIARDLAGGMPLGTALARFNRSPRSRQSGQLMCLLGDPDFRVPGVPHAPTMPKAAPRSRTSENECGQLALLAAYLDTISPKPESKEQLAEARDAVAASQRGAWSGRPVDASERQVGTAMREAVLRFLCTQATIPIYHWVELAYPVNAKDSGGPCLVCGQPDREATLSLRVPGAGSRKVQLCPHCGLTEDRPALARRIGLTFANGIARLHAAPPPRAWAAALLFRPHVGAPTFWPWPAREDGKPSRAMPIPDHDSMGAGQLLLFMMGGASLWIARALFAPGS